MLLDGDAPAPRFRLNQPAGRTITVLDAGPETPDESHEEDSATWAVDAALGAAAIVARTAGALRDSTPGRLATDAARRVSRPLTHEGREVRTQITHDAPDAVRRVASEVTPRVVDAVDLDALLDAVDLDVVLAHIDMDRLLDRIDIDGIIDRVDINRIVGQVDIDAIIDRVDINRIVGRVDIGAILDRLDINAVVDRVDINGVIGKVDVDELVAQTEIGALIARSTSGVAESMLDGVRSRGVGLDTVVHRVVDRVLHRDPTALPAGPPALVAAEPAALPPGVEAGPR